MPFCCGMAKTKCDVKLYNPPSLQELCALVIMSPALKKNNPNLFYKYQRSFVRNDGSYNFQGTYRACLAVQSKQAKTIREICCSICAAYELADINLIRKSIGKLLLQAPTLCATGVNLSTYCNAWLDDGRQVNIAKNVTQGLRKCLKQKIRKYIRKDKNMRKADKDKLLKKTNLTFEENLWLMPFYLQSKAFNDPKIMNICFCKVEEMKKAFRTVVKELLESRIEETRKVIPVYQWSLNHLEKIERLNDSTGDD